MILEDNTRFVIQIGEEPNPVLILRRPTNNEVKEFLKSRFVRKGGKMVDQSVEAREKFVNTLLVDCENVEIKKDGVAVSLKSGIPDWTSYIPLNWKTSIAIKFEEQETVSEEDAKN